MLKSVVDESRQDNVEGGTCKRVLQIIKKEDVCSPTVHNDCVMITSAIDAYERRDVMTIDCPGAFLRALASDPVLMRLRGALVEARHSTD